MKISKLIEELQAIAKEHGDIDCQALHIGLNTYRPITEAEVAYVGSTGELQVIMSTDPL